MIGAPQRATARRAFRASRAASETPAALSVALATLLALRAAGQAPPPADLPTPPVPQEGDVAQCRVENIVGGCPTELTALCGSSVTVDSCVAALEAEDLLSMTPMESVRANESLFALLRCAVSNPPDNQCCFLDPGWRWWCPSESPLPAQCEDMATCMNSVGECAPQQDSCDGDAACVGAVRQLLGSETPPTQQQVGSSGPLGALVTCLRSTHAGGAVTPADNDDFGGGDPNPNGGGDRAGATTTARPATLGPSRSPGPPTPCDPDACPEEPVECVDGRPPGFLPGGCCLTCDGDGGPEAATTMGPPLASQGAPAVCDPNDCTNEPTECADGHPPGFLPGGCCLTCDGSGDPADCDPDACPAVPDSCPDGSLPDFVSGDDCCLGCPPAVGATPQTHHAGVPIGKGATPEEGSSRQGSKTAIAVSVAVVATLVAAVVLMVRKHDYAQAMGQNWRSVNTGLRDRFIQREERHPFDYDTADEETLL